MHLANGKVAPQVVVDLTQSRAIDADAPGAVPVFRGGATLVVDLTVPDVKYRITKNINSLKRRARTSDFVQSAVADPPPCAAHRAHGRGGIHDGACAGGRGSVTGDLRS